MCMYDFYFAFYGISLPVKSSFSNKTLLIKKKKKYKKTYIEILF